MNQSSLITFDQQVLSDRRKKTFGDCTRACVYTIAQEDLQLPHPIAKDGDWNMNFFVVLAEVHKMRLDYYPEHRGPREFWPELIGRAGLSNRGIRHLVVWNRITDEMFHDPHPSRSGLVTMDGWFVLRPLKD